MIRCNWCDEHITDANDATIEAQEETIAFCCTACLNDYIDNVEDEQSQYNVDFDASWAEHEELRARELEDEQAQRIADYIN